jgi:prepilin peptidase CpaA
MWIVAAHFIVLALAAVLLILAALNDAHHYRIPNRVCLGLLALFPLFVLTAPGSIEWEQNLMIFGLVLIAGLVMFVTKLAGAGDIKLLAVVGLWAGPHWVAVFLVTTALAGGLLALTMAGLTFVRNRTREKTLPLAKVPIPYGIAIAAGGLTVLYRLSEPLFF